MSDKYTILIINCCQLYFERHKEYFFGLKKGLQARRELEGVAHSPSVLMFPFAVELHI